MFNLERESTMRENRQRRPLAQWISTAVVMLLMVAMFVLVGGTGWHRHGGVARADVTGTPCEATSVPTTSEITTSVPMTSEATTSLSSTAGTTTSLSSTAGITTSPPTASANNRPGDNDGASDDGHGNTTTTIPTTTTGTTSLSNTVGTTTNLTSTAGIST